MAANIFTGAAGNFFDINGSWSLGTTPSAGDGNVATFDNTSPDCEFRSIGSPLSVDALDFTGYTNTFTLNNRLVVTNALTLDASQPDFAGTGILYVGNSGSAPSITTNGKAIKNVTFGIRGGGVVCTLNDDLTCDKWSTDFNNPPAVCNGNTISILGDATFNGFGNGTTEIIMGGTGTLRSTVNQAIRCNLTINTAGTITIPAENFYYRGINRTFKIVSGTLDATAATLYCTNGGTNMTLDLDGSVWGNITFEACTNTILSSDLHTTGIVTFETATINREVTGSTIYCGGVHMGGTTGNSFGSTNIVVNGTGTWTQGVSAQGYLQNNLSINTAGIFTPTGSIRFGGGAGPTLTYTAGTVNASGSTLNLQTCTLNVDAIIWDNVVYIGNSTYTLSSDFYIGGVASQTGGTNTFNGNTIFFNGSAVFTNNASLSGTTDAVFSGTGTFSGNGVFGFATITIASTANLSITYTGSFSSTTFVNESGSIVNAKGSNPNFNSSSIDSNGIRWDNVRLAPGTNTLVSDLIVTGTLARDSDAASTLNGFSAYIYGGYSSASGSFTLAGTTNLYFIGQSMTISAESSISNNVTFAFDKATITSYVCRGGTLEYVRGIVDASVAIFDIGNSPTLINMHRIIWGGGVIFASETSLTCNKFFRGLGKIPCMIRPASSGSMTVVMTEPFQSSFVSLQNVIMSSGSPYNIECVTINADKGGNSGVIFMAQQLPQGFVDEDWIEENFASLQYSNNWDKTGQGFVRND